MELQLCLWVW